jgi:hypothetical protein
MAHPLSAASSVSHSRVASGSNAPPSAFVNPEMHPSRTQQKLWLQRASSAIEPQKMMPAILPRAAGPPMLAAGMNYAPIDDRGKLDPRLQRQFDQVQQEYNAIRRYRSPVAEAIRQLRQIDGPRRDWVVSGLSTAAASTAPSVNGHVREGIRTPAHSTRTSTATSRLGSTRPHAEHDRLEVGSRRSRVSFDVPHNDEDDDDEEEEEEEDDDEDEASVESGGDTLSSQRDDAYEVCRRLWDMPAAGDGA